MPTVPLPDDPSLEQLRKQAKTLATWPGPVCPAPSTCSPPTIPTASSRVTWPARSWSSPATTASPRGPG